GRARPMMSAPTAGVKARIARGSLPSVVEDGQAMSSERRMHLVAFLKTRPTCHHHGMWGHPESANDFLDSEWYEHVARVLEKGKFDCLFFADTLGIFDLYKGGFDTMLGRGGQMGLLDPMPVLAIMARVTRHIGLGATMSTTYFKPYHIARLI